MNITKLFGNRGESMAVKYLKKNGYKILDRNYRCKIGEIDVVALDKLGAVVFVEVKRRRNDDFGRPSDNVDYRKQKKLTELAKYYVIDRKIDAFTRFDVIEIIDKKINHIIGAFNAVK